MVSFQAISQEFLEESAIARDVFEAAIELTRETGEYDEVTGEFLGTPLHDLFNKPFRPNALEIPVFALFRQETGEVWQAKVFGARTDGKRSGQYLAPKGSGNIAYFPPVPQRIRNKVAKKYGLTPPVPEQSFWVWVLSHPQISITITEGGKKALAGISQGVVTIAVYGCTCGKSPDLVPYLKNRKIYVGFDRDTKEKGQKAVKEGTFSLCRAVISQGGTPRILEWHPSQGKGLDDLAAGGIKLDFLATDGQSLSYRDFSEKHRKYSLDKYKPVKVNQEYLNLDIPDQAQIIAIKSHKKTGKTELLAGLTRAASDRGTAAIAIGHLIKLMVELANRLGLDYRTDESAVKDILGYCLCINSLHPKAKPSFDPVYWGSKGAWVIIDEVEQIIWSLLNNNTLKDHRPLILLTLQTFLRETLANGGKLFLSDADLSSRSLDFCLGLIGLQSLQPYVFVNEYTPPKNHRRLISYDTPQALLTKLVAKTKNLKSGKKLWVATGAQKEGSKYGSKNLEKRLAKIHPPERILRIDSETVADPSHPAYRATDNLAAIVEKYNVIIASPTLETGVNITDPSFVGVFGFFSGVQSVNGCSQALERVRGDCPRYIFAPEKHTMTIGSGDVGVGDLIAREKRLANINLIELKGIEVELFDKDPCLLETWASYASEINYQARCYRAALIAKLETEGYSVVKFPTPDKAKAELELIREIKKESHTAYCEGVANSIAPDDLTYQRLKDKTEKTQEERYQEERGRLARTYLTEDVTPTLVDKDSQGWLAKLTLTYFLTTGREFLAAREKAKVSNLGKENGGRVMTTDLTRAAIAVQVKGLEVLRIKQFLDTEKLWDNDSLSEWFALVTANKAEIKQVFGFSIGEKDTPISVAQRFLGKLGLKLKLAARRRVDGKLTRFYQLSTLDPDDRGEIFTRWLERDCATPPCYVYI
jgi:hypothetical protein